jgi:hypothetical protein
LISTYDNLLNCPVAPRGSSGFISIELRKLRQRTSDGLSRTLGLTGGHCREALFPFRKGWRFAPFNRFQKLPYFANRIEELRSLQRTQCGSALDEGDPDPPHPCKIDLGVGGVAGVFEEMRRRLLTISAIRFGEIPMAFAR